MHRIIHIHVRFLWLWPLSILIAITMFAHIFPSFLFFLNFVFYACFYVNLLCSSINLIARTRARYVVRCNSLINFVLVFCFDLISLCTRKMNRFAQKTKVSSVRFVLLPHVFCFRYCYNSIYWCEACAWAHFDFTCQMILCGWTEQRNQLTSNKHSIFIFCSIRIKCLWTVMTHWTISIEKMKALTTVWRIEYKFGILWLFGSKIALCRQFLQRDFDKLDTFPLNICHKRFRFSIHQTHRNYSTDIDLLLSVLCVYSILKRHIKSIDNN